MKRTAEFSPEEPNTKFHRVETPFDIIVEFIKNLINERKEYYDKRNDDSWVFGGASDSPLRCLINYREMLNVIHNSSLDDVLEMYFQVLSDNFEWCGDAPEWGGDMPFPKPPYTREELDELFPYDEPMDDNKPMDVDDEWDENKDWIIEDEYL